MNSQNKDAKIRKLVREWANISGEYKRERSDWVMLCPSCHRKIDMGKEKLCVV